MAQSNSFIVCHSPLQQHHTNTTPVVNTTNSKSPKVTGSSSPHAFGHGNKHRELGVLRNKYKSAIRSPKVVHASNKSAGSLQKGEKISRQVQACNIEFDNSDSVCSEDGQRIDIATYVQTDSQNRVSRPSSPSTCRQKQQFTIVTHASPQSTSTVMATPPHPHPQRKNEHKRPPKHRQTPEREFQVRQSLFNNTLSVKTLRNSQVKSSKKYQTSELKQTGDEFRAIKGGKCWTSMPSLNKYSKFKQ